MLDVITQRDLATTLAYFTIARHGGTAFGRARSRARFVLARVAALDRADEPLEAPITNAFAFARGHARNAVPTLGRAALVATFTDAVSAARNFPYEAATAAAAQRAGELARGSETEVAEAFAIGMEAATRLRRGMSDAALASAWDDANVFGAFGAAAAAARLLGCTVPHAAQAFGIVADQCSGLHAAVGCEAAHLGIGKAASDAIEAVLLARHGCTGGARALEGAHGLAGVLTGRCDVDAVVEDLGERWFFTERPV